MAVELSIEERYIQHQRGLFVPRNVPVAYVNSAPNCTTRVPYQVCPVKERQEQSLHVVVQNLQKQVNELQTLVRSLQHQVPTVPASTPSSEPVAPAPSGPTSLARTPSEEELLRLHRQRRQAAVAEATVQSPKVEEQPEAPPVAAPMPAPAAPASLRPSATRELSEPRRTQVKRSWIQGLSKGPSLWQVLQQRLCHKEESRPTTRRGTSPDGKADEVTGKMSLEELGKYICSDLERRFGCLEVAAAYAALSMEMCSEQEIDTFLATVEDGERGIRLAPMVAAATLPAISFGAQGFEDALLDVLKVSVSRRNARKLFRQLAALPKKPSAIGSVGTTAQLTQLGKTSLDDSRVLSPGRPVAQTARSQPEKGLSRSKSEGRTVPKTTRVEVGVAKRPSMGVHLQEQIRQHWQSGLRDSESPARLESNDPRPELSNVSSRRSSVKTSPPPSNQNSANPLPMPGTVNRRSYEVWRRDVSLKSLLAFEAEVKARQESSTTSSEDDVRDLPGSSRSSKLPSDSPPSSRLRRSSEEERLEALPARFSEVDR